MIKTIRQLGFILLIVVFFVGCGKPKSEPVENTSIESVISENVQDVSSKEETDVEPSVEEETKLSSYNQADDGTWEYGGYKYKYRLEIVGRMPNSACDTRIVFLSNIEEIPFDRAWKAAGLSSNMDDYFSPDEAMCIEWETVTDLNGNLDYSLVTDSTLKEKILADYEEAYEYWWWFFGGAPVNFDYTLEEDNSTYVKFDYPGVETMDDLKKFLKKRFSDEIIQLKLEDNILREFDGKLYALDACRGSDISIDHVDYVVYYDSDKNEGEITALIYRHDFDEKTYENYLTGEIDKEYIHFTMEDDGAVFNTFPTIW